MKEKSSKKYKYFLKYFLKKNIIIHKFLKQIIRLKKIVYKFENINFSIHVY